jgi:hypothetical protein
MFQEIDSDSGISSRRTSRGKVATSFSETYISTDDDVELLTRANSFNNEDDEQNRRRSDASSITNFTIKKTTSKFHLSSTTTSSHSSGINMPPSSLSMLAISSKESLAEPLISTDVTDKKSKHGVRHFFKKLFGSSSNSSHNQETRLKSTEPLNIDLIHGAAHPPMSPLPITQGSIRLFILRHGERVDRYYSSQWLRQAFDKDGNFCRFSPILP